MLGYKVRKFKQHKSISLEDLVPDDNFYRQAVSLREGDMILVLEKGMTPFSHLVDFLNAIAIIKL